MKKHKGIGSTLDHFLKEEGIFEEVKNNKTMKYKGYIGQASYDKDSKTFHGEVIGLKDVITFQSKSIKELEQAFKDSVDDYLSFILLLDK